MNGTTENNSDTSENGQTEDADTTVGSSKNGLSRRSFLSKSLAVGAGTIGAGLLPGIRTATASGGLTSGRRGPASVRQRRPKYSRPISGSSTTSSAASQTAKSRAEPGNPAYTQALKVLDEDMDQYIHDNTEDEITHFRFLNAYLVSKGAAPANLEPFRTLMGSTATGVTQRKASAY